MISVTHYVLRPQQSWSAEDLRCALISQGIDASINGLGAEKFDVLCDVAQSAAADLLVQQHINMGWDLLRAKRTQEAAVRTAFGESAKQPVAALGTSWDGGCDSALRLDGAKRLAELAGLTSVTLYDVNNAAHQLSIADAATVVIAVASAYQIAFAKKQAKMLAIADAPDVQTVETILW